MLINLEGLGKKLSVEYGDYTVKNMVYFTVLVHCRYVEYNKISSVFVFSFV